MTLDSSVHRLVVAAALAAAVAGCSPAEGAPADDTVHFTPLERQSTVVEPVRAPSPPVDLDERPEYRRIIEGFRDNAAQLVQRDGIGERLDQIERVFLGTGKYLELFAIYQDLYEQFGPESRAAARLAWVTMQLGQRRQARELIDEMRTRNPDNATAAFLDGFYWMKDGNESQEALARAAIHWRRALELDFQGFARISASSLTKQISRLERQLPEPPGRMIDGVPKFLNTDGDGAADEEASESGEEAEPSDDAEATSEASGEEADEEDRERIAERSSDDEPEPAADAEETAEASGETTGTSDEADESSESEDGPTPVGVLMMRADAALEQDELQKAQQQYRAVVEREADHVGAQMGLLRAKWKADENDPEVVEDARELAKSDALSARQAYELGLFAKVRLKEQALADEIWQRVRELDPEFADKVGIGK